MEWFTNTSFIPVLEDSYFLMINGPLTNWIWILFYPTLYFQKVYKTYEHFALVFERLKFKVGILNIWNRNIPLSVIYCWELSFTLYSHWNGLKSLIAESGVGSLIHCIDCQAVTTQTSSIEMIVSRNSSNPSLWWGVVNLNRYYCIKEQFKSFFMVRSGEPGTDK